MIIKEKIIGRTNNNIYVGLNIEEYKQLCKDLDKLEKIKIIVDEANDKINETTDTTLINFLINQAFNKIIEVFGND